MTLEVSQAGDPSWHDNLIYGVHFQSADPEAGKWRSNLVLDIDHIVEWICGTDGSAQFLVAPATLVFHNVTNLRISVDFGESGHRHTINELSIAQIVKMPVDVAANPTAGSYFAWSVELNWPLGGEIAFGASGYTQTLRAEPQLLSEQRLSCDDRPALFYP